MKVGDRVVVDGRTSVLWQHLGELWEHVNLLGNRMLEPPPSNHDWGWIVRLDKPFYCSSVRQTDLTYATWQITVIDPPTEATK